MSSKEGLDSSHPKVIMIYENKDDIAGASDIINEQIEDYRSLLLSVDIGSKIQDLKPLVILFALSTVEKSIELYTALIQDQNLDYLHQSVLLCKSRDLNIAFNCCIKGLFDNYFIYQPLYEKLRLKIIVHNSLSTRQDACVDSAFQHDKLEKIAKDVTEIIENGSNIKQSFLNSIAKHNQDLNSANNIILASDTIIKKDSDKPLNIINRQDTASVSTELEEDIDSYNAKRILVVDDNELYRNMLIKILEKERYHVDSAGDGVHALKQIKSHCYSLILMDLFMPKLDGIHTTIKIKSVCDRTPPPIIALTGNKNMKLIKSWAAQGIKGYIIKPSTKKEILETINKVIN